MPGQNSNAIAGCAIPYTNRLIVGSGYLDFNKYVSDYAMTGSNSQSMASRGETGLCERNLNGHAE
jgi:hypothetical protein